MRRVLVVVLLLALGGCAPSTSSARGTPGRATVTRIVDGDTIHAKLNGHDEDIRILGIDTPETHKPNTPVECFGIEATKALQRLIPPGTQIQLVRDVDARDRYGRLLA